MWITEKCKMPPKKRFQLSRKTISARKVAAKRASETPEQTQARREEGRARQAERRALAKEQRQARHAASGEGETSNHTKFISKKTYRCKVCWKRFKLESRLKLHMLAHSEINDFKFQKCKKGLTDIKYIKQCMKSQKQAEVIHCKICDESFSSQCNFNKHLAIHVGNKAFACEQCEMKFYRKYLLNRHMKIHNGLRELKCNICSKEFLQKINLERHLCIHSKMKWIGSAQAYFETAADEANAKMVVVVESSPKIVELEASLGNVEEEATPETSAWNEASEIDPLFIDENSDVNKVAPSVIYRELLTPVTKETEQVYVIVEEPLNSKPASNFEIEANETSVAVKEDDFNPINDTVVKGGEYFYSENAAL